MPRIPNYPEIEIDHNGERYLVQVNRINGPETGAGLMGKWIDDMVVRSAATGQAVTDQLSDDDYDEIAVKAINYFDEKIAEEMGAKDRDGGDEPNWPEEV